MVYNKFYILMVYSNLIGFSNSLFSNLWTNPNQNLSPNHQPQIPQPTTQPISQQTSWQTNPYDQQTPEQANPYDQQTSGQNNSTSQQQSEFDYIVAGAGPTGSLTAIRLAMKGYKVLLIDAGSAQVNANITTPGLNFNSIEDESISWDFYVKRRGQGSKNFSGSEDDPSNIILYPRSSGLGGCGLHNAMMHVYPKQEDFDKMVELTGDQRWSESNFRNYFNSFTSPSFINNLPAVKLLDQVGPLADIKEELGRLTASHTADNFLPLSTINLYKLLAPDLKLLDITKGILKDAIFGSLIRGSINDFTSGQLTTSREGSYLLPYNSDCIGKGCQRVGAREYALYVAKYYPLTIWTDTLVTKVIIDENKVARGVEYEQGQYLYRASPRSSPNSKGTPGKVYANKEVIISAGTFNTPQILMLSGIGDRDHLQSMGITVKHHLPGVGRNLHDRYELTVNAKLKDNFALTTPCLLKTDQSDPCMDEFLRSGTGAYSFNGVLTGSTLRSNPTLQDPDLFVVMAPISFTGYHKGLARQVFENKNILTFLVMNTKTKNRAGRVTLKSNDPKDTPDINFNMFEEYADEDIQALIKGIAKTRVVIKGLNTNHTETLPGENILSDDQLSEHIQKTVWGHHAAGTCKIGREGDPMAVLDGNFKVRGIQNLRVADLSIFPDVPGYFPVLSLYVVGALAADMIAPQLKDPSFDPKLRVPKPGLIGGILNGVGIGDFYNQFGGGIATNVLRNLGLSGIA